MDIIMRKPAVTGISLAFLALASSCTNADYRREVKVDGAKGRFYLSRTGTAIPLSDDKDAIDYEVGSEKLRIFTGYGAKMVHLRFDKANNLLIIAYCGGRVDNVESSFSDAISMEGEHWKIYRAQVINNPGFTYAGTPICT